MAILKRVKRDFNIEFLKTTVLVVIGAFLFNSTVTGADILRPLAMGEKQDNHSAPQSRAVILLQQLRKQFVAALEYQTVFMLGSSNSYSQNDNPAESLQAASNNTATWEEWVKLEVQRLLVFSHRIFIPSQGAIAEDERTAVASLIKQLHGPLLNRDSENLRQFYGEEIFPLLDRLILQYSLRAAVDSGNRIEAQRLVDLMNTLGDGTMAILVDCPAILGYQQDGEPTYDEKFAVGTDMIKALNDRGDRILRQLNLANERHVIAAFTWIMQEFPINILKHARDNLSLDNKNQPAFGVVTVRIARESGGVRIEFVSQDNGGGSNIDNLFEAAKTASENIEKPTGRGLHVTCAYAFDDPGFTDGSFTIISGRNGDAQNKLVFTGCVDGHKATDPSITKGLHARISFKAVTATPLEHMRALEAAKHPTACPVLSPIALGKGRPRPAGEQKAEFPPLTPEQEQQVLRHRSIGWRLLEALVLRHMKQSELSERSGICITAIYDIINDKASPRQETLNHLAAVLNVNTEIFTSVTLPVMAPIPADMLTQILNQPTPGARFKALRIYRGFKSYSAVARKSGIDRHTIQKLERNTSKYLQPETVQALVRVLVVEEDFFSCMGFNIAKNEEVVGPAVKKSVYEKVLATLNAAEAPLTTINIADTLRISYGGIYEVIHSRAELICHDNYEPEARAKIVPPNLIKARANLELAKWCRRNGFYRQAAVLCHRAIDLSNNTLTRKRPDISALSDETTQKAKELLADCEGKGDAVAQKTEETDIFETLEAEFGLIRKWAAKRYISRWTLRDIRRRIEACCKVIIDAASENELGAPAIALLNEKLTEKVAQFLSTLQPDHATETASDPALRSLLESI